MKIEFPPLKEPEKHGGPGYKRRVAFYSNYLPIMVARRLARRFSITPGSKGYQSKLMVFLKGEKGKKGEWEKALAFRMEHEKESRKKAKVGLWTQWYKRYLARSYEGIYDQKDFLHDWLTDVLSP